MPNNSKIAILVGIVVLLLIFSGCVLYCYVAFYARVSFALEQTEIFEEMRARSLASDDPSEIVDLLDYTVHYYPSGTKQVAGSRLDEMVERARRDAVDDIIARLRQFFEEDYGDDPQDWIDALGGKQNNQR